MRFRLLWASVYLLAKLNGQTVTPPTASLRAAGTLQFSASIPNCLWSTPIGTVNLAGYYQAPLVIPFQMMTTVTCSTPQQSASASVSLTASSLPVAGLEYIRGGNFAGSIIVLAIQPPLFASNGEFGINGATVRCAPSGCTGIILSANGDGTFTPDVNSALYLTRSLGVQNVDHYCFESSGTTSGTCSTPTPAAWPIYVAGEWVDYLPSTSSSGSATLNVNNLGVMSIKLSDGTTDPGSLLVAGRPYRLTVIPVGQQLVWAMTQGDSHQ